VKLLFFPLANKSYADGEDEIGAAELAALKDAIARQGEQHRDDGNLQEGEAQSSRFLPVALQIPVFFSSTVLFVTIEMPRAILRLDQGSSGPSDQSVQPVRLLHFDPTTVPLFDTTSRSASGRSSWASDVVPDEAQSDAAGSDPGDIFDWMPLIFTFMLAGFPAVW